MLAIRRLLAERNLAVLVCAATLLLKLLVPTGYMIGSEHGRLTIELCSGVASRPMAIEMHGDMLGHGKSKEHGKVSCPAPSPACRRQRWPQSIRSSLPR